VLQSKLNKVVESINLTIDETGRPESKKEENKSMEQFFLKKKKKRKMKMKRIR
jgi:hypothetical protein